MEPGPLVVLGLEWGDDECWIRIRRPGPAGDRGGPGDPVAPSQLVPAIGLTLNYRVGQDPTRHCIGHRSPRRNGGSYVDCRNRPQANERTCVSCAVADAEFASDLHHAHTRDRAEMDLAVIDHLEQVNVLYLAAFRDGSIKVGTSTDHRRTRRLLEQGAWRAVAVATAKDGFLVRRLEDLVTERLGIPQSVAVKRKLNGMTSPVGERRLDDLLGPLVDDVHEAVGAGAAEEEGVLLGADPWAFPGSSDPMWQGLHRYPGRLDAGTHHVEILAMCGRMAVLARPGAASDAAAAGNVGDRFVADVGQLFGIEVEVGDFEPDELMVQDSLF